MKKVFTVFLMVLLGVSFAEAAPSHIKRDNRGGYNVTYDYTDKAKSKWYATIRAELNLLNWKNTYNSDFVGEEGSDKYSFEPLFGGSVSVGKRFGYFWRGELEAGYTGMFKDSGSAQFPDGWHTFNFNMSAPYLMVNAMYDFNGGLYLGGGLGAALVMTEVDSSSGAFIPGGERKNSISPMAGLMIGYSRKLDDNFVLDLRYRIAGFNGTKQTRYFEDTGSPAQQYYFENKVGLVLENSFSVGLRYEF